MTMPRLCTDRAALDAACRTDFASFIRKCFHSLLPGAVFLPNWHISALAFHLELVRRGMIRRLIINLPPRSLKSIVGSVAFPAFVLGHDPTKRLIAVNFGSELAKKHGNDFRAILNASWYQRIFPATRISRSKNTEFEVVTTRNGYRLTTSIDGTLTGRGGDIVILDDPLKPIDALSDSKREACNTWFSHTLLSRLDDKRTGAIVVLMQRLHPDDLTGTLLRASDEWNLLSLPAIAEQEATIQIGDNEYHQRHVGDLLHPEREPQSVLDSMRAAQGSDTFAAQYQQAPVPPDGVMIKRDWVRRYDQPPTRLSSCKVLQSWDTASMEGGQNDWSVCTTWLHQQHQYYLLNVLRGRFDYPTLKARAIDHARAHRAHKILIEDTGVGTALVAEMRKAGFPAIAVRPEHDKRTRMAIQSGKFESGHVFLPNEAPWLTELELELFAFPNVRYDDQVDSISQALAHQVPGYELTDETCEGFARLTEGLAWVFYGGRVI